MHLWEEIFVSIGNILGIYLDHDQTYIESGNMAFARILVHLDTREGLEESFKIHWRNMTCIQILDYEDLPFRCRRCHKVGHVY